MKNSISDAARRIVEHAKFVAGSLTIYYVETGAISLLRSKPRVFAGARGESCVSAKRS
ncbi:MAG: hypothetical protein ABR585_14475 [Gemmatimonadaceae bacterium]